jgi:phage gpG-like protein
MSGIHLNFDASPLVDDLHKLANPALVNKAARLIGDYMVNEVKKHFDEQTLWDDSPMPESATARAEGRQTLIKDGRLRQSFHPEVSGTTVLIGSDDIKAGWHHSGTDPYTIEPKDKKALHFGNVFAKKVNHPGLTARPVLGVNPRNEREIIDEITDIIMGAVA